MTPPTVLITGSSGTIGTELAARLLDDGYEVYGVDKVENPWEDRVDEVTMEVDLSDPGAIDQLPRDVDLVVHLAAHARVHQLVEEPRRAQENIDMTFNVLEYARQADVSKIVFSSSREVYGNKDEIIYSESDTFADECESPYTASKIAGEALVRSYQQCYDIDSIILRFSNVYGRFDASNRVVPLFIALASRDRDLTVYGSNKVLDFTYIDDCVEGILRVVTDFEKSQGMTFNIASGEGTSLMELADLVVDRLDADSAIHTEPARTGEIARYVADISRASKILRFEPSYSFSEGIDATIEWYLDNEELFDEIVADS